MKTGALRGMSPTSMTKYGARSGRAPQMQVCTLYFGKGPLRKTSTSPNSRISGSANRGRIWCICRFRRTSTRPSGGCCSAKSIPKFTGFVQEVTPHEGSASVVWPRRRLGFVPRPVAFGKVFAEFAAALFSAASRGTEVAEGLHRVLGTPARFASWKKNNFGVSPNDAGPTMAGNPAHFSALRGKPIRGSNLFQGRLCFCPC